MKLYLIAGLGADERVFDYLKLDCPIHVIKWNEIIEKETLQSYVLRLSKQIDQNDSFSLLGVSFGGIIAIELAKIMKPEKVILVSSVELSSQLPRYYIKIAKTGILNLVPNSMIKPPRFIQTYLFGAENISLLNQIISDTDSAFIRWAIDKIVNWDNNEKLPNVIRIHGDSDKLIPLIGNSKVIKNGKHFMIVDKANEISELVMSILKSDQ